MGRTSAGEFVTRFQFCSWSRLTQQTSKACKERAADVWAIKYMHSSDSTVSVG